MMDFSFTEDALKVVKWLVGSVLIRQYAEGEKRYFIITEAEVYRGEEDSACHCKNGMTPRNKILYQEGGFIYIYLIYGMYYMLNFVTGTKHQPQAILIRGLQEIDLVNHQVKTQIHYNGPGKLTKAIDIDKSLNSKSLTKQTTLRIIRLSPPHKAHFLEHKKRIGIEYADEQWKNILWRFIFNTKSYEKAYSLNYYRSVFD